jgi:hypothetical protein
MTCLTLPISKFFSKFSGEAAALFLYLVIPKTDRLEAAAAAGKTRAAFSFLERSPARFEPISLAPSRKDAKKRKLPPKQPSRLTLI